MNKPRYIYKYHKLNIFFFELITSKEFYLASREELNDPFDLSISISKDSFQKFYIEKYSHLEYKASDLKNITDLFEYYRVNEKSEYNRLLKDVVPQEYWENRTTCFTEEANNSLMWSHYSDNHNGVCIKFDLSKDEKLNNSLTPIKYLKRIPEIKQQTDFKKFLYLKEESWSSEKEWRIVSNKIKFPFKPEAINEIIFGLNTPNNIISWFSYLLEGVYLSDVILSKLQIKGNRLIKTNQWGNEVNISHFRPKKISKAEKEKWKFLY
ncbi:MAG: hypothetical protein C0448_13095 [Sphingobacteriaceae bacterium]|nr:hypothetical protein [Sphingobacteriaceae bacterium]